MRNRSSFAPSRRRRSPVSAVLLILLIAFVGLLAWLGLRDGSVAPERVEQDVTNEVLAR